MTTLPALGLRNPKRDATRCTNGKLLAMVAAKQKKKKRKHR